MTDEEALLLRLFGAKLHAARKKAELTQTEVAANMKPESSVQRYVSVVERGKQNPSLIAMHRLAKAVGKRLLIELVDC